MSDRPLLSLDVLTVSIRHTIEELNRSIKRLDELGVKTSFTLKHDINGMPKLDEMTLSFDLRKTGGDS